VTKSRTVKRKSTTVTKKRILRLEVHKHVHRRFAGIRGGKKGAAHHLKTDNNATPTPAIAPSSYASMF
jgi:hypothetical protein